MLGIPVVDTGRITVSLIKLTLFIAFATIFFGFMDVAVSILQSFLSGAFGGLTDFNSLNLGCVSTRLGLISFLNSLLATN